MLIIYQDQLNLRSVGSWTILGAALLITIGLNMIFKQRFQFWYENVSSDKNYIIYGDDGKTEEGKGDEEFTENEAGSTIKVSSFLNTTSRYIQSQNLRRIDVKSNLSDVNLYLDNAMLQDGHATIKVDISLGDVNIYVPRSWEVNNNVDAFLADVKFVGMRPEKELRTLKSKEASAWVTSRFTTYNFRERSQRIFEPFQVKPENLCRLMPHCIF